MTGAYWLPDLLPEGWGVQRAKTLMTFRKRLNEDRAQQNILSLTMRGVVRNDPLSPVGQVPSDYASYQLFDADDLVFKLIDLENVRTSRVGLVPERGIMSPAYQRFSPRPDVSARFLYYYFYSLYLQRVFNHLGAGVRATLSPSDVQELPVVLPPLDEQRRIADFLDDQVAILDRTIHLRQQQIDLLEEHRAAEASERLLSENVLHDGIQVRNLISSIKTGGTPNAGEQWVWEDAAIPWYGPAAVAQGLVLQPATKSVTPEALARNILPQFARGSVLVVGIGATAGRVAYLDHEGTGNQQMTCLVPKQGVEGRFLAWSLWTRRQVLLKTAPFTTLPILNNETLKSVRVPDLSTAEQYATVVWLDGLQQKQAAFQQLAATCIALLTERKQALITAAVTGKFDVTTAQKVDTNV